MSLKAWRKCWAFSVFRSAFHGVATRVPFGSGTGLFDVGGAVEAVVADDRLFHAHFTGFLNDEGAFLIEAGNADYIRVGSLNLGELGGEIGILVCKGFGINDINAHLLEQFFR